jgi:hypothetical protein
MMGKSNVFNQGIAHAAFRDGGEPLCKRRGAHMSLSIERFLTTKFAQCKRCAAKLAKGQARKDVRETRVHLGDGILTWGSNERVSDRYGTVYLMAEGNSSLTAAPSPSLILLPAVSHHRGKPGKLVVRVLAARDSTHIGDLFRRIFPRRPKVGQEITLGTGVLFSEPVSDGGVQVGLRPDDGRDHDWLDPRALYDAHEQTVSLYFVPVG